MAAPARAAALRVLRTIASGSGDLGDALARTRDGLSDARDRALATELATGTLRWRNAIDYQLQQRSARPLHKLDAAVLDALRLGAYQLLHLDRVPISAIVNDSVELVKRAGFASAAGFANAVLRRLARERDTLSWPPPDDLTAHLAVVHSHPAWLVERWLTRYGPAVTETWLRFNNQPPAMTVAANRLRGTREQVMARLREEGLEVTETTVAPHGITIGNGRVLASRAFLDGFCVIQDEASQVIPELAEARPGARVLDLCASPGGKTISLAAQCGTDGTVVATDIRTRRVALLAQTIARCAALNARVVHIPARGRLPFADARFDCILIDAPCSGLGTIRRDPDIRWRRGPSELAALAATQRDLLLRARSLLKPGGRIVYSTCSSEPEENEDVVTAFLAEAPAFRLVPLAATSLPPAIRRMETDAGCLRTSAVFGLESFFGAILLHDR
jgi:16S rRNA (cytosine967-C5)-methyltransferase